MIGNSLGTPLGGQQQQGQGSAPSGGIDINALMQMLQLMQQGQMQQQGQLIDAATRPQGGIAQSPMNGPQQAHGLNGWYAMNPQARQGESYAAGRQAQVQDNQVFRQQQGLQQRIGLAGLLNQLTAAQNEFTNTFQGDIGRLPVNPFIGL